MATAVLLLDHAPFGVPLLLNDADEPAHIDGAPLITPAVTVAFTVIDLEVVNVPQPVTVYVIVAVPALTPVTTPLASTMATLELSLVHEPPAVAVVVNDTTEPTHTEDAPLITPAVTDAFTVIVL
jgi:hypothetical protein